LRGCGQKGFHDDTHVSRERKGNGVGDGKKTKDKSKRTKSNYSYENAGFHKILKKTNRMKKIGEGERGERGNKGRRRGEYTKVVERPTSSSEQTKSDRCEEHSNAGGGLFIPFLI